MTQTRQQLEVELIAKQCVEDQRKISDERYAIKLVEKIVFALVGLILTAVVIALLALIIKGNVK